MESFAPAPGGTKNIDVSGSSQSVDLGRGNATQVRIYNDGTATVWISHGPTGVAATTSTGMPVGAGVCEVITLPPYGSNAFIAAIAAGTTGKIYFTPGGGI